MATSPQTLLLAGNYSNKTGYAWNNIYRLFNVVSGALREYGVDICLSFAKIDPPVSILDRDIPHSVIKFDPYHTSLASVIRLARDIRKHQIRFVYFTDQHTFRPLYLFMRICGVRKIIVHNRTSVSDPFPAKPEKGLRRLIKTVMGRLRVMSPDRVYAVSDFVRNRLIQKNCFPAHRVVTILNGVNTKLFESHYEAGTSDPVRIFVGSRATRYKGIDVLIQALYLLREKYDIHNFVVEFAGDGPDLPSFKTMVSALGLDRQFKFLGELSCTRELVCKADIIVAPSAYGDACPSSVSEALAAGKPLVTTVAGGIPEMVGEGGNAVLIPPSNHELLARELSQLILDPAKRSIIGKKGKQRARQALDQKRYHADVIRQLKLDLSFSENP